MNEKEKRLFMSNYDDPKWDRVFDVNHILEEELGETHLENGIVLPLQLRTDIKTEDEIYKGGVVAPDFSFVAGLKRHYEKEDANISVCRGYEVPQEELVYRDETVVFGGILYSHFGDTLLMTSNRLWWFTEHPDTPYKFVFLNKPGEDAYPDFFFDVLGLARERVEVIDRPTSFKEIIIPDESCYILTHASRKWLETFEYMKENVRRQLPASPYEKIYLSRTKFQKFGTGDGLNEAYYENFFAERGFHVVYPETLPFAEQINVIMHAKEIACVFGTLSHMALFAQNGIRQINIMRTTELWIHQAVINQVKELDFYWIEGTINPLATPHNYGYFLYYPTKYFKAFLDSQGIDYPEEEFHSPVPPREMVLEYIMHWTEHFSDPEYNWRVKDKTTFEHLHALSLALFGKELSKEDYQPTKLSQELKKQKLRTEQEQKKRREQEKINEQLRKFNRQLLEERDSYKERLEKTQSSASWKITKPMRDVHKVLKKVVKS